MYTPYPQVEALCEQTRTKADKFYEERFARLGDGVLILCGDLPEEATRKMLLRHLGAFPTARGNTQRRAVEMRSLSGVTTCSGSVGPEKGFHVLLDTPYALTTEHYYTAQVAVHALQRELARHLSGYGYSPSAELLYCTQPQERFQVLLSCAPISAERLPADVGEISPERALTAVRAALRSAAVTVPQEEDVQAWKENVREAAESAMSTPEGFVRTLLERYSASKDVTTHYREALENIGPAAVKGFLASLERGGRVEYLVK